MTETIAERIDNEYCTEDLRAERSFSLFKFAESLGSHTPHAILNQPESLIPAVSKQIDPIAIPVDSRSALQVRLGYFIGELLIVRFHGQWMIDREVGSSTYSHQVVGNFVCLLTEIKIDPFDLARHYLDAPPPRNLVTQWGALVESLTTHCG